MFYFKSLLVFYSILLANCQNNNSTAATQTSTSNDQVLIQNEIPDAVQTTLPFKENDIITFQTTTIPTTTLASVAQPSLTPKPVTVETIDTTRSNPTSVNSTAALITTTTSKYSNETADRRITLNMYFIKFFLPKTTKGMKIRYPFKVEFDDLNKKIVVNEWYNRFYGTSTRIPYRFKSTLNPFNEKFYNIYFKKLYL